MGLPVHPEFFGKKKLNTTNLKGINGMKMKISVSTVLAFLLVGLMAVQPVTAQQASKVSEEEAHAIGVHAYVYFYSLITMDVTRKQLTNVEPGKGSIGGPMNMFNNIPAFPTADLRVVVRPNFDTLYSSAWLDLTKEPVIVSVPDTSGQILPHSDARYVDGRVRVAWMAHDGHAGG